MLEESNLGYSDIAKLVYKINSILNNTKEKIKPEDLFDDNQEDLSQLLKEIYDTINK